MSNFLDQRRAGFVRPDGCGGAGLGETVTSKNGFCSRPSEPMTAVIYLMIGLGVVLATVAAAVLL